MSVNLYKVIIIGGGASGLAALTKLWKNGVENCLLLEAQSELGGRIKTVPHGDHVIEFGAQWVHGEDGNVVYNIAKENDLLDEELSLKNVGETLFIKEDSTILDKEQMKTFQILMARLSEDGEKEMCIQKGSVGDYYTEKFLEVNKWGDTGLELLDWYGRFQCCIDGTDNWFEASCKGSVVYEECPGNQVINWKGGYRTIVDYFKREVPEGLIRLESPVKRINWQPEVKAVEGEHVEVELTNGEVLRGEHVIVTLSLAVLKSCYDTFFEPKLPPQKVNGLEGLGIDVVDKIFLEFPYGWWGTCDGFSFLRKEPLREFNQQNWDKGILGFYEVYRHEKMLCAWITGRAAKEMEKAPLNEVSEKCMTALRSYLKSHYTIPEPVWCDRTKWYSNPYVKGCYSFRSVTSEVTNATAGDLASPICSDQGNPLVCFAGEATHERYYSTVHGAVETGWREADRILAHVRCNTNLSSAMTTPSRYEVVIIGAGVSGLGAAKELEASGITSVVILEASDRIGGRVDTVYPSSGGFVDLGAQWIHGQHENHLYEMAATRGLVAERVSVDGVGDFYTDEGKLIDDSMVTEVLEVCRKFKEECESLSSSKRLPPPSIGHYLRARFEEYLNSQESLSPKERMLKEAIFQWDVRWERIDNACDSLDQLSAKHWGDFLPCKGFYNMNPKYGMSSLVESLRNDIKCPILFDSEVVNVNYSRTLVKKGNSNKFEREGGFAPVRVRCRNGKWYECDHVIVTCSVGYLQAHRDEMFSPKLPEPLDSAISNLGFDVIDKIFLEFERPFWRPDCTAIGLVWTKDEIPDFDRTQPDTRLVDGRRIKPENYWYRAISSFDPVHGHGSILCGWIGGAEARFMESLNEEEVGRVCASLLRRFTNNQSIPDPKRVIMSKWATNKWFLGSYSHRRPSCDVQDDDLVQRLNSPVNAFTHTGLEVPLISFAGEAASFEYYSTVHGAMSSGVTQAKSYIKFLKRQGHGYSEATKSKL